MFIVGGAANFVTIHCTGTPTQYRYQLNGGGWQVGAGGFTPSTISTDSFATVQPLAGEISAVGNVTIAALDIGGNVVGTVNVDVGIDWTGGSVGAAASVVGNVGGNVVGNLGGN